MPLRGTPDHENGALFGYSDGRRFSGPGRNLLGAWSPRVSLTRTALRTREKWCQFIFALALAPTRG